MTIIDVVQSDKLYKIDFTLNDADDNAINLTDATILIKAQREMGTALAFSGSVTVGTAVSGMCYYTVQADDFSEPGRYYCEIEVTYVGGKIITLGDIIVNVKPQLPRSI